MQLKNELWTTSLKEQETKVYDWAYNEEIDYRYVNDEFKKRLEEEVKKLQPNGKLLDVGCGTGEWVNHFNKKGYKAEGLTLNEDHAAFMKEKGLIAHVADAHDTRLPSNHYDIVWCSHIIEHMFAPVIFLREMNRILKTGGLLVIMTPTHESQYALNPAHYTCFTAKQLTHLCTHSKFNIIKFLKPLFKDEKLRSKLEEWDLIARKISDWKPLLNYDETKGQRFSVYNLKCVREGDE